MYQSNEMTGKQKAAILLIALGPDISAQVLKHMREDEIEKLTLEIANQRKLSQEQKDKVLAEFHQMCVAKEYISNGGLDYAREVLEKALGSEKAVSIINRLTTSLQIRPFDFARKTDPSQLLNFIQNEHPQTIALIMAYLQPEQSAAIVSALPPERQVDVARRIATMDRTSPDVIRDVERILERKLSSLVTQDFTAAGGVDSVVDILNRVDRTTERTIIENMEVQNPELAEEIKKRMFVFEDIVLLDDRSLQLVLREIDNKDLALALKATASEVSEKVYKNISKRAGEMLREEIEYMGPVRIRDVEEAQQKIVNNIRRLEESGEIVVSRGKGDEIIV
ncbi:MULTISPECIES: flagellar motor switch protein FliG [Sporomusa]|jgi:flagellar motor switch protein FliG|uniref:Flagellar motor switch protein FliG n=2 Tax=Sporomusa TaxID=2375 RepID=A0ABM9VYA1_9FIRM|nr:MULTISPECIES: flagellar motor switch protein FliG [Sporomusa]MCM0760197.1 flagellar motor switch protein FliG [Sporomusa sphaeroides DSM 2875]OLS58154.1 flagellar motor switch protein FliG [Sporomusa sphaeroides DSM 2875]CVK17659.1 Flagellar motor switch protein FliG [Sporomusa sphaeroides DSM 2875]SCM80466.1 Flagellar motor switch protein FliG [uncultured Sporomusa sp.]HML31487.1 flagellar motor switch protein FliG [Sporomusa sphaeroides]